MYFSNMLVLKIRIFLPIFNEKIIYVSQISYHFKHTDFKVNQTDQYT